MTANQLAYLEYAERQRSNLANEAIAARNAVSNALNADTREAQLRFEAGKYDDEAYLRNFEALESLSKTAKNWSQALGTEDLIGNALAALVGAVLA